MSMMKTKQPGHHQKHTFHIEIFLFAVSTERNKLNATPRQQQQPAFSAQKLHRLVVKAADEGDKHAPLIATAVACTT